jgi:hypothetical protein
MNRENENKLDRLFKDGLTKPDNNIPYRDEDWQAMENLLDERKPKGLIYRLPLILSSAAAILLLAFGLFLLNQKAAVPKKNLLTKNKPHTGKNGQPIKQQLTKTASNTTVVAVARLNNKFPGVKSKKSMVNATGTSGADGAGRYPAGKDTLHFKNLASTMQPQILASNDSSNNKQPTPQQPAVLAATIEANVPGDSVATVLPAEKRKKLLNTDAMNHPITLSIIAAPDFNGVGSAFNRTQIGTNAGLMLSVGITNKLTISTGAVYAKKPYAIGFNQYQYVSDYKFKNNPTDVMADCRVLDIPLNISYQVYHKGINQLSIGTGLSSYFMLSEKYTYSYASNLSGVSGYEVKNQNRHLFGVMNINATYQRRINSKFGLNVQPYMKLPLTDIGYGRVNLKSTGVAFGASWYFNTSRAKK